MTRPVPGAPDNVPVTLGETGNVVVSSHAAQQYARHRGLQEEEARRELTTLLIGARRLQRASRGGAEQWRIRSRPHRVGITAHVARDQAPLVVVVHVRCEELLPRPAGNHRKRDTHTNGDER